MKENIRNEIYIGYNGSGKTSKLEEINKDLNPKNKNKNVIYIPTEQNFEDELKKEKTSKNGNFIYLIKEIIYKIFGENDFIYKANEDEIKKIENREEYKNEISKFLKNLKDDDFIFKTENFFKDKIEFNTLDFNLEKYETPSGKNNYSLIKILGSLFKYAIEKNINIEGFDNYYLIIDEPEKFSHPNLIKKIAFFLKEISNNINVILSTHSPSFISNFLDNQKTKVFLKNEGDNEFNYFIVSDILKKLKFCNDKIIYRFLNNNLLKIEFFEMLFSKKVILVEDITTKTYLSLILNSIDEQKKYDYSSLITFGWNNIDDFIRFFEEINFKNTKIIVDSDGSKGKNYTKNGEYQSKIIYEFEENIEKELGLSKKTKTSASDLITKNLEELKKKKSFSKIKDELLKWE